MSLIGDAKFSKSVVRRQSDVAFLRHILALGKFAEPKIDELLEVLQGKPVIIWNLRLVSYSVAKFLILN